MRVYCFVLSAVGIVCGAQSLWAGDVHLSVHKSGDADVVEGSFWIQASSSAIWGALIDYDKLPQFVPALQVSRVKERRGNHVLVEQRMKATFLFFSRVTDLTLEISERPYEEISFEDISHHDFEFYRGFWRIEEVPPGAELFYVLEARRSFAVPDTVARRILKKNAQALFKGIRLDILRRTEGK